MARRNPSLLSCLFLDPKTGNGQESREALRIVLGFLVSWRHMGGPDKPRLFASILPAYTDKSISFAAVLRILRATEDLGVAEHFAGEVMARDLPFLDSALGRDRWPPSPAALELLPGLFGTEDHSFRAVAVALAISRVEHLRRYPRATTNRQLLAFDGWMRDHADVRGVMENYLSACGEVLPGIALDEGRGEALSGMFPDESRRTDPDRNGHARVLAGATTDMTPSDITTSGRRRTSRESVLLLLLLILILRRDQTLLLILFVFLRDLSYFSEG